MPVVSRRKGFRKKSRFYHVHDGYYYHRNRKLNEPNICAYRCTKWYLEGCRGRAHISDDGVTFEIVVPHTCERDRSLWKVRQLRRNILKRCATRDPTAPKRIVSQEGASYSRRVRMNCSAKILRSAIRRARCKAFGRIPDDLSQLHDLLSRRKYRHLTQTSQGDLMYAGRCGSSRNRSRCLIFMSAEMKRVMSESKTVFSDATWDGRPSKPGCSQIWSVTTKILDQVVPLAVVLMESKTLHTYKRLIRTLKELVPNFNPSTINCDFEKAEVRAWKEEFPRARVQGCLFHYASNISKYARQLGFHNMIINNHRFSSIVRSCLAIPLVPTGRLEEALGCVIQRAHRNGFGAIMDPFFEYIYNEYIMQRKEVLSVHGAQDRTNNISESWNRMLQDAMSVRRPNIRKFLNGLLELEDNFSEAMYSLLRGRSTTRGRKRWCVSNDIVVKNLTTLLDTNRLSMSDFLRRASWTMRAPYKRVFPDPQPAGMH